MPVGKYNHKNVIQWNTELIEELSKATGKPAQSLRLTIRNVAEDLGLNLKQLHEPETVILDFYEFTYIQGSCTIYVYVNGSNPKTLIDEVTYKTPEKAKRNFEKIKNYKKDQACNLTVTDDLDFAVMNQEYEKTLEATV
jgi:hypothetical protein